MYARVTITLPMTSGFAWSRILAPTKGRLTYIVSALTHSVPTVLTLAKNHSVLLQIKHIF